MMFFGRQCPALPAAVGENMLTPTLKDPIDLLHKLERERYRAFHSQNPLHKADHLYNFCVTALSARDYLFESLGWNDSQKEQFSKTWNQKAVCVACSEIANSSKHCYIRDRKTQCIKNPKTKSVTSGVSSIVDIYEARDGSLHTEQKDDNPDFDIVLADGSIVQVYEFTESIIRFWRQLLIDHGFKCSEQSFNDLSGATT